MSDLFWGKSSWFEDTAQCHAILVMLCQMYCDVQYAPYTNKTIRELSWICHALS